MLNMKSVLIGYSMQEITKEQAVALSESRFWEDMTYKEIALFQMNTEKLCMPFNTFHEALEKALGRTVLTLELGLNYDGVLKELHGEAPTPSFEDIINLIPKEKRMIVMVNEEDESAGNN